MKHLILLALITSAMGCMYTKIVYDQRWDSKLKPSYVDYMDSYFLSLWGHPEVSITKVCMDQRPLALQRENRGGSHVDSDHLGNLLA